MRNHIGMLAAGAVMVAAAGLSQPVKASLINTSTFVTSSDIGAAMGTTATIGFAYAGD